MKVHLLSDKAQQKYNNFTNIFMYMDQSASAGKTSILIFSDDIFEKLNASSSKLLGGTF